MRQPQQDVAKLLNDLAVAGIRVATELGELRLLGQKGIHPDQELIRLVRVHQDALIDHCELEKQRAVLRAVLDKKIPRPKK